MAVKLSNLKPKTGSKHRKKRIARGDGSGYGTYSGRGQKGQRSRSGGKKGLKLKGLRRNIKNIPKLRGFKSKFPKMDIVNLEDLQKSFTLLNNFAKSKIAAKRHLTGSKKTDIVIGPEEFLKAGLIRKSAPGVKILGRGKLTKKLTIRAHAFSKDAEKAIKKAGGKAIIIKKL